MMSKRRYDRLQRYAGFQDSLARWQSACCAIVGLGGLGGGLALHLARLGIVRLILIDRDIVGEENLGHQPLFTEEHARQGLPKAIAASEVLSQVNSEVALEPHIAEANRHGIHELLAPATLLFDGLDNYYTRFLLNDYALSTNTPYFYAGVVRGELSAKAIIPGVTSCLRCVLPESSVAGQVPLCATEGLFPPLLGVANALQLEAANQYLAGNFTVDADVLYGLNISDWRLRQVKLPGPQADCPACGQRRLEYLAGEQGAEAEQVCAPGRAELKLATELDLNNIRAQLSHQQRFDLKHNPYCLVVEEAELRYTLFADGTVVMEGGEPEQLNRFTAEYLGT